jgi:hypothetical protein
MCEDFYSGPETVYLKVTLFTLKTIRELGPIVCTALKSPSLSPSDESSLPLGQQIIKTLDLLFKAGAVPVRGARG